MLKALTATFYPRLDFLPPVVVKNALKLVIILVFLHTLPSYGLGSVIYFCKYIILQSVAAFTNTNLGRQIDHYPKKCCMHEKTVGGAAFVCLKPVRCYVADVFKQSLASHAFIL